MSITSGIALMTKVQPVRYSERGTDIPPQCPDLPFASDLDPDVLWDVVANSRDEEDGAKQEHTDLAEPPS